MGRSILIPVTSFKKSRIIGEFGVGLASEIAYILQVCAQPQKPARLKFPQFYDFFLVVGVLTKPSGL